MDYQLVSGQNALAAPLIRAGLKHQGLERWITQVDSHPECDSTNNAARRAALAGQLPTPGEVRLVIANSQTAGRGRLGRSWQAQPGENLTFSLLFVPRDPDPKALSTLTLLTGLAVYEGLAKIFVGAPCERTAGFNPGSDLMRDAGFDRGADSTQGAGFACGTDTHFGDIALKWPNDVIYGARNQKLCGILAESSLEENRVQWVVVGIGINVNTRRFEPELQESATSLALIAGREQNRLEVLLAVLQALHARWLQIGSEQAFLPEYRQVCRTLGQPVTVRRFDGSRADGLAIEINDAGELLVRLADGQIEAVRADEVTLRPE